MNSRTLPYWTSVLLLLALAGLAVAQPLADARVEWAGRLPDGRAQVQISLPRGETVADAALEINGESIPLETADDSLPQTWWVLLDASGGVLNTAPAIQNAVERFRQTLPADAALNLLLYAEDVTGYGADFPERSVEDGLEEYAALANQPGCVSDALRVVAEAERDPDAVRRVLLVGGSYSRQGLCDEEGYVDLAAPVDVVVVSPQVDDFYLDLVERSGGSLERAILQNIQPRLDEVAAAWANPVIRLRSEANALGEEPGEGQLTITFSSGATLQTEVALRTVEPSPEMLATFAALTPSPTATFTPSSTPSETPTPTDTLTPTVTRTSTPTATNIPTDTATPTPSQTHTATATPSDTPTNTPTETTTATETASPTATETPTTTATATDAGPAVGLLATPGGTLADGTPAPLISNEAIIILGGILAIAMVIGTLLVILGRNASASSQTGTPPILQRAEDERTEPIPEEVIRRYQNDFYDLHRTRPIEPLEGEGEQPADGEDQRDTLIQQMDGQTEHTEIVSMDELMASTQPVTAYLYDEAREASYEIRRPETLLGRLERCDITIKGDPQLSREHVRFVIDEEERIWMHILTRNPVAVNGTAITERVLLHVGDELQLTTRTKMTLHDHDPLAETPE